MYFMERTILAVQLMSLDILYNILLKLVEFLLPASSNLSKKMKFFVEGRKQVFPVLKNKIKADDKIIWVHAASLGEFEQAVPVIEMLRKEFPQFKVLVTFFSPSGYENKKHSKLAEIITYLPLDTAQNAEKFLDITQPELVFFIKYDLWPNYLKALKTRKIRTFLISGAFRDNQYFFKNYGSWMRKSLESFEHFFVQDQLSKDLLNSIGFTNVSISGDTRFDRVSRQIQYNNKLEFLEDFLQNNLCIVAGSTWPEDEALLIDYINEAPDNVKFIIAPHEIKPEKIDKLKNTLHKKAIRYSEIEGKELRTFEVLLIDTIGILSKIYSYASIAYVGGAAGKTGLHNILEPATFGVPIVIGQNFKKFPEAIKLEQLAGLYPVSSKEELALIFNKFLTENNFRVKAGMIAEHYINSNTGATTIIQQYLQENKI